MSRTKTLKSPQKAKTHILERENSTQKSAKNLLQSLDSKREIAKLGMSVSLLTCVGSAFFMKNNSAKTIHLLGGVALVGFSIWHHSLYEKK